MRHANTPTLLLVLLGPALSLAGPAAAAQTPPAAAVGGAFPGQYAPTPAEREVPGLAQGLRALRRRRAGGVPGYDRLRLRRLLALRGGQAALAPPRPNESRVVFFGDSITDNWSKPGYGGFFPGKPYVNRGIGGQTTAQMLLRFRADVIALQPKAVVILAGTNDIAGNSGPVTRRRRSRTTWPRMAELAQAARHQGRAGRRCCRCSTTRRTRTGQA